MIRRESKPDDTVGENCSFTVKVCAVMKQNIFLHLVSMINMQTRVCINFTFKAEQRVGLFFLENNYSFIFHDDSSETFFHVIFTCT